MAGCGLQPVYLYDPQGFDYLADEIKANAYPTFTYGQYALWDPALPANITDYNLCIDSLEEVPQEKVNLVLDGIALRTRIACFFRIPTSEPPVLWLSQIARRFAAVDYHIEPADHPFKQTLVCTAWKKPR